MGEPSGVGASTVPAEERLVYQGEVFINFRTSRQWVSIKLFALPPDADDHEVLALLIRHVRYRDSYGGTGDRDMETIHGPYWLKAITPEVFFSASAVNTEALIRTWADYTVALTAEDRAAMEREVYPRIRSATSRYQLPDLRDTALHDWGSSVGSDGFYEFALIDRQSGSVALLVASDD